MCTQTARWERPECEVNTHSTPLTLGGYSVRAQLVAKQYSKGTKLYAAGAPLKRLGRRQNAVTSSLVNNLKKLFFSWISEILRIFHELNNVINNLLERNLVWQGHIEFLLYTVWLVVFDLKKDGFYKIFILILCRMKYHFRYT